jgi:multicomponent K+:H+ antiporter subunit D
MTKVGVYALLRMGLLLFGDEAGASAGFGRDWIYAVGVATLVVGVVGVLAVRELGGLAGYSLLISVGTLLGLFVFARTDVLAAGLLYLVISTLAAAAFFMLVGLISPTGEDEFDEPPLLEAYDPEDDGEFSEEDERPVVISAPMGILSGGFLVCTLLIAGIPPLPGFLAKVAMLKPLLQGVPGAAPEAAGLMAALIIASSLFSLIALARAGIQIWWADPDRIPPTIRLGEAAPVAALVTGLLILTILVQRPFAFMQRTAAELSEPRRYIEAVLSGEATR